MVPPPLAPSQATQSLPVELFPTLFSFCSPSTLAAWCATSTSVLKLAGPVLYSTVVIREPEDYILLFKESDVTASHIAPFLSLHQIKHLVLSTGLRQVHSSALSFERITPSKGEGGEVSTLRIHSLTLTNPDTSDFSGLFSRLSPTHLVLCRPQGERSIFDHAIDVRAEDTILRHWTALESVTLRGANMLSLRPTRSGAFYSNSEFFLVPASTYLPPANNHHHNNLNGNGGNGWQNLFPPNANANANAPQPNPNNNQPNHAVGFHLNAHHHHTLHVNTNNNHHNINHFPSRHVSSRRQPINIIFDLRPQFLPPHLAIPSPLTCSWFMRCLRAREADRVFDVPGVKEGWGPEGDIGGGKLIVRVADEETKEWVERGRCHLKGTVDDWIEVAVGDDKESTVDGWPLV